MTTAHSGADPGRRRSQPQASETLTARQLECLRWVQEGKTAWEIGQILGISARTVEGYLAKAYATLGVRTRVQAVLRARQLGLIG